MKLAERSDHGRLRDSQGMNDDLNYDFYKNEPFHKVRASESLRRRPRILESASVVTMMRLVSSKSEKFMEKLELKNKLI
jgi:hypothetical protein